MSDQSNFSSNDEDPNVHRGFSDDDVEGHRARPIHSEDTASSDEDDVEGHRARPIHSEDTASSDEDDVEGHRARPI